VILAQASLTHFFAEAVDESMKVCGVEASVGTKGYLVCLLEDFSRPDGHKGQTFDRPLAFLLDEALRAPSPAERFERLRAIGDGVLYTSGFFGEAFERRGIDPTYLHGIGSRAYGGASALLHGPSQVDVFGELARGFAAFAQVVKDIADQIATNGAAGSQGVLRLYERWLKTGSERLAEALTEQGLAPARPVKGLQ
jgi:hypothetical protein